MCGVSDSDTGVDGTGFQVDAVGRLLAAYLLETVRCGPLVHFICGSSGGGSVYIGRRSTLYPVPSTPLWTLTGAARFSGVIRACRQYRW